MLWDGIKNNILLPASTRMGTGIAGALVGYGVETGQASVIGTAVPVMLGVGIDLMLAWFRKRSIQQKAVQKALA